MAHEPAEQAKNRAKSSAQGKRLARAEEDARTFGKFDMRGEDHADQAVVRGDLRRVLRCSPGAATKPAIPRAALRRLTGG